MRAYVILLTISTIAADKVAILFANKTIASTVSPEDLLYPVLFPIYRSSAGSVSNLWTSDALSNCQMTSTLRSVQLELNCTITKPIADAIFDNADQQDLYVEIIYQDFNDAFRQHQKCGPWGRFRRPLKMMRETRIATAKGNFSGWQATHYQTFVNRSQNGWQATHSQTFVNRSQKYPKLDIAYHC